MAIPFVLMAGKGARVVSATLNVTSCNVATTQACILVTGSGYASGKNVTIDVDGPGVSDSFVAPANRDGIIALYIYESYDPGYYTVTAFQGTKLAATAGVDIP